MLTGILRTHNSMRSMRAPLELLLLYIPDIFLCRSRLLCFAIMIYNACRFILWYFLIAYQLWSVWSLLILYLLKYMILICIYLICNMKGLHILFKHDFFEFSILSLTFFLGCKWIKFFPFISRYITSHCMHACIKASQTLWLYLFANIIISGLYFYGL